MQSNHPLALFLRAFVIIAALLYLACGGASPAALAQGACPMGNYSSSSGTLKLDTECTINGSVTLSGNAELVMTGATLTINGVVSVSGSALLTTSGGALKLNPPLVSGKPGTVTVSNNAGLTATAAGTLEIAGNLDVENDAVVYVAGAGTQGCSTPNPNCGTLEFPQKTNFEYHITLNGSSTGSSKLELDYTNMLTNNTTQNETAMTLSAYQSSVVNFKASNLGASSGSGGCSTGSQAAASWLLGDFYNNSTLTVIDSQNLPTEVYPEPAGGGASSSNITIEGGSGLAGVWLDFPSGSNTTFPVPPLQSGGVYSFNFGPKYGSTPGILYNVTWSSSSGRLGLNSHSGSTLTVIGNGVTNPPTDVPVVFGYYVDGNYTGPVTITGLPAGSDTGVSYKGQFTDTGRNLTLTDVVLNPFVWQVYVSNSGSPSPPVYVKDSFINEIAAMPGGNVFISGDETNPYNSVLQLAVVASAANPMTGGLPANVAITNTDIWSQLVEATGGGKMSITDSNLHGNVIMTDTQQPQQSFISIGSGVIDLRNGLKTQMCTFDGQYPQNNNGVPLFNPFNLLHECSQVSGNVVGYPGCTND